MCIADVLHMYYSCMNYMCNTLKHHTCITHIITHVTHLLVLQRDGILVIQRQDISV